MTQLAIMQPYLFPYLGYFQLIAVADRFVFYDDVAFIEQGWVNRNRLLVGGRPHLFTVPVRARGGGTPIHRTAVDPDHFPRCREKLLRTLRESYSRAPYRSQVLDLVAETLDCPPSDIGSLARRSVELSCRYCDLEPSFLVSSRDLPGTPGRGAARVLEICRLLGATTYVNLPGGRHLYDPGEFRARGLRLAFLEPRLEPYPQRSDAFVPRLSILDLLMSVDPRGARAAVLSGTTE